MMNKKRNGTYRLNIGDKNNLLLSSDVIFYYFTYFKCSACHSILLLTLLTKWSCTIYLGITIFKCNRIISFYIFTLIMICFHLHIWCRNPYWIFIISLVNSFWIWQNISQIFILQRVILLVRWGLPIKTI